MASIFDRVKAIIIKQLNVEDEQVTGDANFVDDLGADSIDAVELIMAIETEFNIDIPEKDAETFLRVDDVVAYLESRLGERR